VVSSRLKLVFLFFFRNEVIFYFFLDLDCCFPGHDILRLEGFYDHFLEMQFLGFHGRINNGNSFSVLKNNVKWTVFITGPRRPVKIIT